MVETSDQLPVTPSALRATSILSGCLATLADEARLLLQRALNALTTECLKLTVETCNAAGTTESHLDDVERSSDKHHCVSVRVTVPGVNHGRD